MSTSAEPTGSPSPFFAALQKTISASAERDAEGERVGGQRTQLFHSSVVEPYATLADRWVAAWERIANALRKQETAQVVAALLNTDGILAELKSAADKAREQLEEWFRGPARDFNKRFPDQGQFHCVWDIHHDDQMASDWRLSWANSEPSPAQAGAKLAERIGPQMESLLRSDRFQQPVRVVALLSLFGLNSPSAAFENAVSLFASEEKQELAAVWPILALIFLPVPGLLERFFQSRPTPGAIALARCLLYWGSGIVVQKGVEAHFDRLNNGRQCGQGSPSLSPVTPTNEPASSVASLANAEQVDLFLTAADLAKMVGIEPKQASTLLSSIRNKLPKGSRIETKKGNGIKGSQFVYRASVALAHLREFVRRNPSSASRGQITEAH